MTRPIFEPSLPRTDRKLGFSADQLFRRPAPQTDAGIIPWARLKFVEAQQSIDPFGECINEYDDYCNNYPDFFGLNDSDPQTYGFRPLIPGLYQITGRVFNNGCGDSYPNSGYELNLKGIDWDEWGYYSRFIPGDDITPPEVGIPFNTSINGYIEVTFRAGPDTDISTDTAVFMEVVKGADAVCAGPGTYLEIRCLGTDPYWPQGLDTDAFECST